MTAISERQHARLYIYKAKQIVKRFILKKARHFAKSTTISVTFLNTKIKTLYVTRFFMKILKLAFIYKNHDTLRYVKFLYSKIQTLRKKEDNLRYVFMYKNPDNLRYAIFYWFFLNGGGGGILICKKMHSVLNFDIQKTMHFALRFTCKNPDTLR